MSIARRRALQRITFSLAVASSAAGFAGPATAQPSDGVAVALEVDPCLEVDAQEVHRLFSLELGTSAPEAVERLTAGATRVEVGCAGPLVELRVHDPITGKSLTRQISLGQSGRERLLALAVTELVIASWIELETTPAPAVPPAAPMVSPATRSTARRIASRRLTLPPRGPSGQTTLSLLGGFTMEEAGALTVGGLRIAHDGPSGLGWSADLTVAGGGEHSVTQGGDLELGTVDVRAISASVTAHAHTGWRMLAFRAALGARITAVRISGAADSANPNVRAGQVSGIAGGPLARLSLRVRTARQLWIELAAEPGYHLAPVRGTVDGREETSVEGPWLGAQLGLGWSW